MNWRKIGKISLYLLFGLVLITSSLIGYFYYQYQGKYEIDKKKHAHIIGYLDPSNNDPVASFSRCGESDTRPIGYYSSSKKYGVYKNSKRAFRKFIQSNYQNKNYSDTGFLNLRFLINCRGEIGDMEVNELDKNLEPIAMNESLVNQIIELTVQKQNWQVMDLDKPQDMYMYLIYKLENGAITEILP